MIFSKSWATKLAISGSVLLALTALLAADAKKATRVIVFKADRSSVAGDLVDATPAGVSVKTSPKADSVLIPWADIKRTSNGLTRQKVVAEWRANKADQLCESCHGEGTRNCEACRGTGVDPSQSAPCVKCDGSGSLGKCPKCTDGKVPCPATCIKESDFSAGLKDDAAIRRSRLFKNRDGSGTWYHEQHIGELMVNEKGTWVNKGKCPTCGGTSRIVCPTCEGTAKKACPVCQGVGVTGPACSVCKSGKVDCKVCSGTGLKSGNPPNAMGTNP